MGQDGTADSAKVDDESTYEGSIAHLTPGEARGTRFFEKKLRCEPFTQIHLRLRHALLVVGSKTRASPSKYLFKD